MKRFVKLFTIFISPIVIVFFSLLLLLYYGDELFVQDNYKPLSDGQLIGIAYTDINASYKYAMTESFQPEIVALGSSRIMQVRESLINEEYSFYNAGGAVGNLYEIEWFFEKMSFTPQLIILNIDQICFNPNFRDQRLTFNKDYLDYKGTDLFFKCRTLLTDILFGKVDFIKIFDKSNDNIGLSGKIKNNGFLRDGSYYYGFNIDKPSSADDFNFKDTYYRIEKGKLRFEYCDRADTTNLGTIDSFLKKCSEKGTTVIAILPPFAPQICKKLRETGRYNYMNQIYGILSPIFNRYQNCYLYDYTDMTAMGVHNYDFIDGFHGSEIIYNLIIQDIIEQNNEVRHFFKSSFDINALIAEYKLRNIRFHTIQD